jgi:hypothetical protein
VADATYRVRGDYFACGIPGYDRGGRELHADELRVHESPFEWELSGNCAFATHFEYVG